MERQDVAYLINTTPKYFYLLELHVGLIRRYAPGLKWTLFLATEVPDHPVCKKLAEKDDVKILPLAKEDSGFLKSRAVSLAKLPSTFHYVLPMQEDFLLERFPDAAAIEESFRILETDSSVKSIRWMPCPGPAPTDEPYSEKGDWRILSATADEYLFSFQATLWKRHVITTWYEKLVSQFDRDYPHSLSERERREMEIRANYAENARGQAYFREWMMLCEAEKHLAWTRIYRFPNAVYMSPWPYRPTAVVGGRLEEWAVELGKREGWPLRPDNR